MALLLLFQNQILKNRKFKNKRINNRNNSQNNNRINNQNKKIKLYRKQILIEYLLLINKNT